MEEVLPAQPCGDVCGPNDSELELKLPLTSGGPGCRRAGRPLTDVSSALRIHGKGVRFENLTRMPQWTDSTGSPPADSHSLGPSWALPAPARLSLPVSSLAGNPQVPPRRVEPTSPGWAPAANTPD